MTISHLTSQTAFLHTLTPFLKRPCTIQALQYQDFISLPTTSPQVHHHISQKTQENRHVCVKNPLFLTVLADRHCCPPFRYEKDSLSKKEETTCIGSGNSRENPIRFNVKTDKISTQSYFALRFLLKSTAPKLSSKSVDGSGIPI